MTDAFPSTNLEVSLAAASQLQKFLTFRQMRKLCKQRRIRQYSYLAKDEMAMIIALDMVNKLSRKHHVSTRKRTKV
jgi:predicted HTH domain antitoxin